MRRKVKLRTILLAAGPLLAWALPVMAEDASEPIISIISGLAPDDLLNIRATPSPTGKTEARLPSGTALKNHGCNTFNGYPWCKVEDAKNPRLVGWAPARYLTPDNPATISQDQAASAPAEAAAAEPSPATQDPAKTEGGDASDNGGNAAADNPATSAAASKAAQAQPVQPPDDLAARLGGNHGGPVTAADIGKTAMQDAVGLAFAASDNPSTGEIPAQPDATSQDSPARPTASEDQAPVAAGGEAQASAAVPVPTPRPDGEGNAPAVSAETVARLEPPSPRAASVTDTTGEIPCARYLGQPMTQCAVQVVRGESGKADVTVNWPDGGARVISFYSGKPAGADSRGEFRFTREGTLNMIRVGASERFEITDALALGD